MEGYVTWAYLGGLMNGIISNEICNESNVLVILQGAFMWKRLRIIP